jgi:hypothetical protein
MNDAIKVTDIVDHEDGSATITLDMDPATYHKIFEQGFLKLIQRFVARDCMGRSGRLRGLHRRRGRL